MRAPLAFVNIRGQEPLAIEVRFQVAAGKRQIAPATAICMTPPVDVGEGLVVKGQAAHENLGAGFNVGGVAVPLYFSGGFVIHTCVIRPFQSVHEGVLAGSEDGLDDAGLGIKGTSNSVNLIIAFFGIIDIIGIECFYQCLQLPFDAITSVAGPLLEDPLEVRANFSGHVVGRVAQISNIRFKRFYKISHKSIQTWPLIPTIRKLTLNRRGQPR
ncbi:ATP citrate lyase [Babesia caballi]|uniref:ATP citrate lyase n=1 Tax=Babesia caballi TaxID=5871 RepID=A0AAV4LP90_BABCB|nr:ATP citrate lyase [Babesia caballi]